VDVHEEPDKSAAAQIADHLGPETETTDPPAGTMRAGEAGSVPSSDTTEWVIEVGADVIGTCGHKVGEVVAVRDDVIVVEKGFFMPMDFYIPKSAIHRNNEHGLYLNVTKNEALHHGWDVDPASRR
jgi:nucleotide-binding universal stress UspA family protein